MLVYSHLSIPKSPLLSDIEELLSDFQELGIFQRYGTYCLLINSLLVHCLRDRAHSATLAQCYAVLESPSHRYFLGHQDFVRAEQLAGHVACIVKHRNHADQTHTLVDFGLGNLQKMTPMAPQVVATTMHRRASYLASITLKPNLHLTWWKVNQIPNLDEEFRAQASILNQLIAELQSFQQQRRPHGLHQCYPKLANHRLPSRLDSM
ncbi:hypothetical protein [Undibacterium fentianense]|uniref:Uncharacterized protein n=1 Tax=Undibacterium fentianense TaxID=2828728 RepID=A0A941E4C1_9BURK|nr:hypothetical protein [Undibacterium fentianense]MBR7800354.1 hypothetical protein [Undibacterium fentianense]